MEIREIGDYYDKVQEKFPDINKKEIEKILNYGMRSFYMHNLYGADVLLKSRYFTLYSGKIFDSNLVFYKYWRLKNKIKLRIKYKRNKERYNGEYYFGMTDKEFENYNSQFSSRGRRRQKVKLEHVYAYKILEECILDRAKKHFFLIKYPEDMGFTWYRKEAETRNIQYIYKRNSKNQIESI